jgi:hypothetical protein
MCGVRTLADRRGIRLLSVNNLPSLSPSPATSAAPTYAGSGEGERNHGGYGRGRGRGGTANAVVTRGQRRPSTVAASC